MTHTESEEWRLPWVLQSQKVTVCCCLVGRSCCFHLHPEVGGNMALRNVGILQYHYTMWHLRRLWLESYSLENLKSPFFKKCLFSQVSRL